MNFIAYTISRNGIVKYVGITTSSLARRWGKHCCNRSNGALQRAIRKHGRSAFEVEHVASSWDRASLNALEVVLVKQHGTFGNGGYNLTAGGNQPLFMPETYKRTIAHLKNPSPEMRKHMSEGARRRYSTAEGKLAASLSQRKRWTKEAREKQAERARLQARKPGEQQASSERAKRWFGTQAFKAANSIRVKARLSAPEERAAHAARIRAALSSPEAKKKMSDAQRRRYYADPEAAARLHAAQQAYFERRRAERET